VTDAHDASATSAVRIVAGNEPPVVAVDLAGSNRSFYFPGVPVRYAVSVTDREDGSLRGGSIPASRVSVSAQYLKDGAAPTAPAAANAPPSGESSAAQSAGRTLIEGSDCLACHQVSRKSIGPAYADVARRYHDDSSATARLVRKIRAGGSGVWGSVVMPAHPQLTAEQASAMVSYILSLADRKTGTPSLPTRGSYLPPSGSGEATKGVVMLRAAYTDRGANEMPALSREKTVVLHSPTVVVANGELSEGLQKQTVEQMAVPITVVNRSGASVTFRQLDLTGVSGIVFATVAPAQYQAAGGKVEVRLDSATGPLVGESELIRPTTDSAAPPALLRTALRPTSGLHDVYLVFRGPPNAKGDQFMFGVTTATFESGSPR
jgi:cytochrome c